MYGYGRQGKWLKNELKSDIIKCIYDKKFDYSKNRLLMEVRFAVIQNYQSQSCRL